ncbi:MAG TPA: hypothetical protein VF575_01400 [Candidatus Saccharimonadales bacterium]|jgi:hypothetical protein
MMDREPLRLFSGQPLIAVNGEVVEKRNIAYLQFAAEELNALHGIEQYTVRVAQSPEHEIGLEHRPDLGLVIVAGKWATHNTANLSELVDRAEAIKRDLGDLDIKY